MFAFIMMVFLLVSCSSADCDNGAVENDDNDGLVEVDESTEGIDETQNIEYLYNQNFCLKDLNGFYYCTNRRDENGDFIYFLDGRIAEFIEYEDGIKLYYDKYCPECGYVYLDGFTDHINGEMYFWNYENYNTYFYDNMTGEITDILEGLVVSLSIDDVVSDKWFAINIDTDEFKLMDCETKEWYNNLYLSNMYSAPSLSFYYELGNGEYFKAYKYVDGIRYYYIMDYDGNVLKESKYPITFYNEEKSLCVDVAEGKYGLLNTDGTILLSYEYDAIETYRNGIVGIKNDRLYVYSLDLVPIINGTYKLSHREYNEYLCCDNTNNFWAYDDGNKLIVTTIDTDYYYDRENKIINPEYTHKLCIEGNAVTELQYDYRY